VSEETQKAILALDGGGMRGAFTLEFLGEPESLIAQEIEKKNDFVLADYSTSSAELLRARLLPPVCRWAGVLRRDDDVS
jgi:hypothetical protein